MTARRVLLTTLTAAAVVGLAPLLLPAPDATDFAAILRPPSATHPLGTDHLGRDVLARLVAGARVSLGLALTTVVVTGIVGCGLGLLAGYPGGRAGRALLRAADVLAALPSVLFGLLAAVVYGPGFTALLVATCVVAWAPFARQTYQLTVREAGRGYVDAAVALGAGPLRVRGEIAVNIVAPLVAHATVRFAGAMLTVSGLSFLGLGVQPPTAEWGAMVAEGRENLFVAPHVVLAPAVAVVAVAAAATALGRRGERVLVRQ